MKVPTLNIKSNKVINLNVILTSLLILILLSEGYFAFNFVYKNFLATPTPVEDNKIVRLNSQKYHDTIDFIDRLSLFVPNNPVPLNFNPFK